MRSGDPKPHAQDVVLLVHNWGFTLSDIRPKTAKRSIFSRIFFFLGGSKLPGFSGPIHIFHVRYPTYKFSHTVVDLQFMQANGAATN